MTIKRRLLAIIIALITIISISGCGNTNLQSTYTNKIDAQVLISSITIEDSRYKQFVVYDPATLVMYTLTWDYISGGSTITALYNADKSFRTK